MKKKILIVCVALLGLAIWLARPVSAISEVQKNAIADNCAAIREDLKTLQHNDSRARVYLGRYYETILNKFIVQLNMRLLENSLLDDDLRSNQVDFKNTQKNFTIDYIEYQKALEDLVGVDCKSEPERFYRKLVGVREKRQIVAEDTTRMKKLMLKQINLVEGLREKL